jgi:phosphate transport system protein
MSKHLERDLRDIEKGILTLGAMVEESIDKAITSLTSRRKELAQEVLAGDEQIDIKEVEFEEECLKVLALHQPVATDLRFLVAAMKVNHILERMGDLACNIAKCTIDLIEDKPLKVPEQLPTMVATVRKMVRESLDGLIEKDTDLSLNVCKQDDLVDDALKEIVKVLKLQMRNDPDSIERSIQVFLAARHLERIADMATNIAEDVVFMVKGEIIRHGRYTSAST